jgi:methylthioribose-1-phosphate isomerase
MTQTHTIPESLAWHEDHLTILNQQKLPNIEYLHLYKIEDFYEAIALSKVNEAPAMEITAAYGLALAANAVDTEDPQEFVKYFQSYKDYLASSRPTSENISRTLNRLEKMVRRATSINEAKTDLLHTAIRIHIEVEESYREISSGQ